jgi:regulator of protease activity HflC (stomatin/prohibitin superfamily)
VTDYWTQRKQIGDQFCKALNKKFVYANCTGFQLLTIEMNDLNENAIIKTQLAIQQGFQKQYEQDASNITAKMTVDTSEAQRQITVFQGEAQAQSTFIQNEAQGNSTRMTIDAQANAYKIASQLTGQTAGDTLMDYIYYTNLLASKNSTILVGVDKAMINVGKGY